MGWLSDTCHGVLDVAGFVPAFGAVPDVINAGVYAIEGNHVDAKLSLIAAVPLVGDIGAAIGKGGKYLLKLGKLLKKSKKVQKILDKCKFLKELLPKGGKLLGKMKEGATGFFKKGKDFFKKILEKIKKWFKKLKDKLKSGSKTNYDNKIPRSGTEWNEYFKEKYGADNVRWNINSVADIFSDQTRLKGYTADELQTVLGNNWTRGTYGSNGGGWKLTNGDVSIFYHPGGGIHGGSYYGISSGPTGKIKVVNPNTYIPLKGDKATIIYD